MIAGTLLQESQIEGYRFMTAKLPASSLGVFFRITIWVFILALPGCSLQKLAVDRLGNALAESSSVYATDDDPDLVGAALPFGLKTIEGLLAQSPHNRGLLLAATSGFTQYAYGFVQTEADFIEDTDLIRAIYLRERALRLYRRALGYGIRGLGEVQPGFADLLRSDPERALALFGKKDVALLTGLQPRGGPPFHWTRPTLPSQPTWPRSRPSFAAPLNLMRNSARAFSTIS